MPRSRPLPSSGAGPGALLPLAAATFAALAAFTTLTLPTPTQAQGLTEALQAGLLIEERLLEGDLDRYAEARREEREAFREMDRTLRRLDEALTERVASITELRRLEGEAAEAREAAFALAREVGEIRRTLFERLDRLEQIRRELRQEDRRALVTTPRIDGIWELEVSPIGVSGLVRLRSEGTIVSGTYRMSSGAQGSVRGTFVGTGVTLERIDFRRGFDATLRGDLDAASGRIAGGWTAVDVTGGALSGGSWSARKLSPEEERERGFQ